MVSLETPVCDFGQKAKEFSLLGIDGQQWSLEQCLGPNGLLLMFICNHCPYVKAVAERIVRDTNELKAYGIESVAIMSNDSVQYPDDSFENMQRQASEWRLAFPYLIDPSQEVARAYGAVCTPDFFGYNARLELQYRGRLDASRKALAPPTAARDLFDAMVEVSKTGKGPRQQIPSMGCSIKWRNAGT